jgi:D-sedoheptulose 7-phosphate isomerase
MNLDQYLVDTIKLLEILRDEKFQKNFDKASKILLDSISTGGSIVICGNGGSHADAQHFAGELINYFTKPHKALPVFTLGTNSTVATAWSNDHKFSDQFSRELEAYRNQNSVLVAITTSGKSENVINALEKAGKMGFKRIALTGSIGSSVLQKYCDVILAADSDITHKIQETHIVMYHALCIYLEQNLPTEFLYESGA